jgi:hypothetical protein
MHGGNYPGLLPKRLQTPNIGSNFSQPKVVNLVNQRIVRKLQQKGAAIRVERALPKFSGKAGAS